MYPCNCPSLDVYTLSDSVEELFVKMELRGKENVPMLIS